MEPRKPEIIEAEIKILQDELNLSQIHYEVTQIFLGADKHEYLIKNWKTDKQTVEHYIDCKLCHYYK